MANKRVNANVAKAKKLVDSVIDSIKIAKDFGENSVKIPYDYWYENKYVGELVFEHFNREKVPMMVRNDYVDGKPVGKYICVIFDLNKELII